MGWKCWSRRDPSAVEAPCKVLLTNGRFPVALDLARQLKLSGAQVYVVDPMHYHVCKFSNSVQRSYRVPAPHEDPVGYVQGVMHAIRDADIDVVIPIHEEIFYLAECGEPEVLQKLFAPNAPVLLRLHSKWGLTQYLASVGLDVPKTTLCRSLDEIRNVTLSQEMSLKPVYGRAASQVYHLKPGEPLPEDVDVSENNNYVMQDWIKGKRYCSYAVLQGGKIAAFSLYPVEDTMDGDSCVYFKAVEHQGIYSYVEAFAESLGEDVKGQVAFDFVETADRLVVIDCNPRATSGIHLFSGTPHLGRALTGRSAKHTSIAKLGSRRQVTPGMLMAPVGAFSTWKQFLVHLWHLIRTRDVMFKKGDLLPSLMQPFLLASYYEICREKGGMKLADMFQSDFIWEPHGRTAEKV